MKCAFRSIDFWKSALMALPDDSFFELLRTVLGKIKTPFSKPVLLHDLESFLSRDAVQKTIAAYIDERDARIIAAIAALGEPLFSELESFFAGELNYASLHYTLINLEERFLVYRFREQELSRLALNPVLEPVLSRAAAGRALLVPPVPLDQSAASPSAPPGNVPPASAPAFDDRILAALLAFVPLDEPFFKNEGDIRKRILDMARKVFPGLALEPLAGSMCVLGLFHVEEQKLIPDRQRFAAFGKLSRRERMEYCAAGIVCGNDVPPADIGSPWLFRSHLATVAGFIHQFMDSLETDSLYPLKTLKALAFILDRGRTGTGKAQYLINTAAVIDALTLTGFIVPVSEDECRVAFPVEESLAAQAPVIALDAAFSCLLYPEIAYTDAVRLASAFEVREAGVTVRFELTRDSAMRAFTGGFSAAAIIDLLNRLSHNRVSENLIWTLTDWEKRSGEVTLCRGLLLRLAPERRYLAEAGPLAALIRETVAPGVYVLPETAESETCAALRKAGVDMISVQQEPAHRGDFFAGEAPGVFAPITSWGTRGSKSRLAALYRQPSAAEADTAEADGAGTALIAQFNAILDGMRLSREERIELAARINRKLVLNESHLKEAVIRYEKLEARGLDYVGKAMIAKQAISLQSLVELSGPGKSGEHIFGIPRALEKEGGETMLVLCLLADSGGKSGDVMRIPLGKISLLRRIKQSIFESTTV
jgi:hypothetical protein